jgi:hypothetical protein
VLKDFQSWVSIENVQSLNLNYKNNTGDVVQYIKQFAELEEEKKAETDNIVENTKEGVAQAKEQITEATAEDLISKLKVTERYQNFLSFELQKNAAVQIALKMLDQDLDLGNYGKKRDGVD